MIGAALVQVFLSPSSATVLGLSMAFRSSLSLHQNLASTSASGPLVASINGSKFKQVQSASKPAPVLDLPALHAASRVLQEQLVKDSQAVPDLGDMICMSLLSRRTASCSPVHQRGCRLRLPTPCFPTTTALPSRKESILEYRRTYGNTTHVSLLWPEIGGVFISRCLSHPPRHAYGSAPRTRARVDCNRP